MTIFARVLRITLAVALFSMLPCFGVSAQMVTLEQYRHPKAAKDLELNRAYLIGVKDALIAYNMSSDDKQFCLPGAPPSLTFEQANDMLVRWANKTSVSSDLSLGLALLYALKRTYPCAQ